MQGKILYKKNRLRRIKRLCKVIWKRFLQEECVVQAEQVRPD